MFLFLFQLFVTIILMVLMGMLFFEMKKPGQNNAMRKKELAAAALGKGLLEHNQKAREAKERAKADIMKMIVASGSVTNQQIQEAINISDATATRYLDQLEQEGSIVAEGGGKFMRYKAK